MDELNGLQIPESLADALHLSAPERAYVFELTRRRDPSPPAATDHPAIPAELLGVMRASPIPAYLLDRLWHVRGCNEAARHLFSPWFDSGEGCLLRYVFLYPGARDFIDGWNNRAHPFNWTKTADQILTKANRQKISNAEH